MEFCQLIFLVAKIEFFATKIEICWAKAGMKKNLATKVIWPQRIKRRRFDCYSSKFKDNIDQTILWGKIALYHQGEFFKLFIQYISHTTPAHHSSYASPSMIHLLDCSHQSRLCCFFEQASVALREVLGPPLLGMYSLCLFQSLCLCSITSFTHIVALYFRT